MQHCLNILYNGDTFYDIFTDECSVKIEWYTRRSFYKVCLKRSIEEVAVFCPHKVPHRSSFHVCVLKNLFFFHFFDLLSYCIRSFPVLYPFCTRPVPILIPVLYLFPFEFPVKFFLIGTVQITFHLCAFYIDCVGWCIFCDMLYM